MKNFKRFLASLMVAVIILTVAPLSGFAGLELKNIFNVFASAESYSGACGENLTWSFDNDTGELVISGTGDMYDYKAKETPWYRYIYTIYKISIADGVTSIGNYAFDFDYSPTLDMPMIKYVDIPESVTRIGDYAFSTMALYSVTIPDSVVTIGEGAFAFCPSLSTVTIETENASIGKDAFTCCLILKKVTITGGNIGQNAFGTCENLAEVVLGNGVQSIGSSAFRNCYNLENLMLPDSVEAIGEYAFYYCRKLTDIIIPDSVKTIGDSAFENCENLAKLVLGNGVESIGSWAFVNTELKGALIIPDSVTSIDYCAFSFAGIDSVTIPVGLEEFDMSFADTMCIKDVYFKGNKHQWEMLLENQSFGFEENEGLTIHFESDHSFDDHTFVPKVTAPTCTSGGYTTYICECSESFVGDYVDALGHDIVIDEAVKATCTTTGLTEGQHCTRCDDETIIRKIVPVSEHSYKTEVTAPTCTSGGYTTYTCICGDSYIQDYTSAEDHAAGEWEISTPATVMTPGIEIKKCSGCGVVLDTRIIPAFGKVNSVLVSDISLDYKASTTITPSITVDSGVKYTVTYSSSNPSVASVDANGKVVAGKTGSATITVTVTDEFGNTVSDTCTVKVNYNWWQWIIVIVLFGWIWY